MTKTEEQELGREVTIYRIQKDFGDKSNTYRIDKVVACVEQETYHVQINPIREDKGYGTLWCDCRDSVGRTFPRTNISTSSSGLITCPVARPHGQSITS